jgi:hypothetical protein
MNTTAVVTLPLITAGGHTDRMRWCQYRRRMVCQSSVNEHIITAIPFGGDVGASAHGRCSLRR